VPPTPFFGIGSGKRGGTVELSGVSFTDLTNTRSISAATLSLYYWDELSGRPSLLLANGVGIDETFLDLSENGTAAAGSFVQVDGEVMRVEEVQNGGARYRVARGMHTSPPATHEAQAPVYPLLNKTTIASFPPNFFGSPYGGSWSYPVALPNARVATAELFVTNRLGNSATRGIYLTSTVDNGLRTLSGGQYSVQVDGFLAVEQAAAPALVVETVRAVRDVFAVLGSAADAPIGLQLNVDGIAWCTLTIAAGWTVSDVVSGLVLTPLPAGSKLTLAVTSVGQTYPGANLTVVVRL
jgi:hypothetical protein